MSLPVYFTSLFASAGNHSHQAFLQHCVHTVSQAISAQQPAVNWNNCIPTQPTEVSTAPLTAPGVHASVASSTTAPASPATTVLPVAQVQRTAPPSSVTLSTSQQQPLRLQPSSDCNSGDVRSSDVAYEERRLLKRAANRRSAQMSRTRKKRLIEELKEENDELRYKEQILRSIPDLIVVFDSTGRMLFVSHSAKRFLGYKASELEGRSFWKYLCNKSVCILKAAFMDAMAAKRRDSDTAPLGTGLMELQLVERDANYKVVRLNGVVNFSSEGPECVCSIRPRGDQENHVYPVQELADKRICLAPTSASGVVTNATTSKESEFSHTHFHPNLIRDISVKNNEGEANQQVTATSGTHISDNESYSCD